MVQAPSSGKGVHSLLAGSGAKSDSTSSLVTPSGVAGFHRGALSLSTITARTPSTKSGRRITWQAMRYSIRMLSAKLDLAAPSANWRKATLIVCGDLAASRSEEHTSELQSLMRISYAVFCLKKKKNQPQNNEYSL